MLALGTFVVVCSRTIVFPGLESLLGIETFVGRQNVYYLEAGGYAYTNLGAMVRWVAAVATGGVLLAGIGVVTLDRTRPKKLGRPGHEPADPTAV